MSTENNPQDIIIAIVLVLVFVGLKFYQYLEQFSVEQIASTVIQYSLLVMGFSCILYSLASPLKDVVSKGFYWKARHTISAFFGILFLLANLGYIVVAVYSIVFLIVLIIISYRKRKKNEKLEEEEKKRGMIKELEKFKHYYSSNINDFDDKINELLKIKSDDDNVKTEIEKIRNILVREKNNLIQNRKTYENKNRQAEEKQQRVKGLMERLINDLVKTKNLDEIPSYATELGNSELSSCVDEARRIMTETKHNEIVKLQAKEWFFEHVGYPSDYPDMDYSEQEIYRQMHNEKKRGNLITKDDIDSEDQKLYGTLVIETKRLTDQQRKRFENKYGYVYVPFTRFDGKGANNVLILKNNKQESNQHFIWKHLFAQRFEGTTEKKLRGLIADVFLPERNIILEIETGKNRISEIKKKLEGLEKRKEEAIIICPRGYKSTYQKYSEKVKIMTPKQAYEYLSNDTV